LSSRNAYLTPHELTHVAPTLYAALDAARIAWEEDRTRPKHECVALARTLVEQQAAAAASAGTEIALDYVEMNDPETFDVLPDEVDRARWEGGGEDRPVILSGAMWVGAARTRLIDNVVLGDVGRLGILSNS
jgi:pantoate--beta-alanine ligase